MIPNIRKYYLVKQRRQRPRSAPTGRVPRATSGDIGDDDFEDVISVDLDSSESLSTSSSEQVHAHTPPQCNAQDASDADEIQLRDDRIAYFEQERELLFENVMNVRREIQSLRAENQLLHNQVAFLEEEEVARTSSTSFDVGIVHKEYGRH
ncbi:hypothetical protein BDZ89DRAFT_720936 [Hymenopellis radicata]|nr:hypothetical protein BDZ89DRAFT_720936 [Hymenopellis radicata]